MWMTDIAMGLGVALALVALYHASCLRVITQYARGVIVRLRQTLAKPPVPGLIMIFEPVEHTMRIDLRTVTNQ